MNTLQASQARVGIIYHVVRWAARLFSIVSAALLAAFLFGGFGAPTPSEAVGLALFPGGVALGMAIGWRREGLGGAVTVASLAAFYVWMTILDGHPPRGPYFALFAAPGLLFLAAWALRRQHVANTT
jgi:hypothetical protein